MGDARFQAWMGEHLGVLHRIARAFAASADQHDLLQELMLAVWRAAPRPRSAATRPPQPSFSVSPTTAP